MLSADHVEARRSRDELKLVALGPRRAIALDLAEQLLGITRASMGQSREQLEQSWRSIDIEPRFRKLFDGLCKLVEDRLDFSSEIDLDPVGLRAEVFTAAAAARRALGSGEHFQRDTFLRSIAESKSLSVEVLERALYSDLKGAQLLRDMNLPTAEALVEGYELAQAQAVLLRATRVVVRLRNTDPSALRWLFRKLKFHRLLVRIEREDDAYRLEIDGPFSLFEAVTKYGLALAVSLPSLIAVGDYELSADIRWGKERLPLVFRMSGASRGSSRDAPTLSDDAESLRQRVEQKSSLWNAEVAEEIVDVPGVGICVPDLRLTHRYKKKKRVLVEVMGYWSRDAVFERVEMFENARLKTPILLCVSERLRVSEKVLEESGAAALLVYKGVIPISPLESKLDALCGET